MLPHQSRARNPCWPVRYRRPRELSPSLVADVLNGGLMNWHRLSGMALGCANGSWASQTDGSAPSLHHCPRLVWWWAWGRLLVNSIVRTPSCRCPSRRASLSALPPLWNHRLLTTACSSVRLEQTCRTMLRSILSSSATGAISGIPLLTAVKRWADRGIAVAANKHEEARIHTKYHSGNSTVYRSIVFQVDRYCGNKHLHQKVCLQLFFKVVYFSYLL